MPSAATPPPATPEFMWCQRSDRVYVTIKVADWLNCLETSMANLWLGTQTF